MGAIRFLYITAITSVFLLSTCIQSFAATLPEVETQARAYADALRAKHGSDSGDVRPLIQNLAIAVQAKKWPDAVRLLEELAGLALGGKQIPGETTASVLYKLGLAWQRHQNTADEGVWAAYLAQSMAPSNRGKESLAPLVTIGEILLSQVTVLKGDFDYRSFTLDQIGKRLKALQYDPARIASEDAQGRLPANVRELMDLKSREEEERMLLVDKITKRMRVANVVYEELTKSSDQADLSGELKKAINQKLFYVKRIYTDTQRATAAICLEFNLPLRPDAGEYRDMVKVFPVGSEGKASDVEAGSDKTVKNRTICMNGLRHGLRYHILVRKGLPSKSGATLTSDVDTRTEHQSSDDEASDQGAETAINFKEFKEGLRIPDRKPSAGFRSMAFILPKFGGGSIPLMTVNIDRVDLELVRTSDRTIYRQLALGQIGNALNKDELADLKQHFSDSYWQGGIDVPHQPNDTITSEIPLRQLLDNRNSVLASLKGKNLADPFTSEPITTGNLHGRFHVDKLSVGAPEAKTEEPGVFALLAKASRHSDMSRELELGDYESGNVDDTDTSQEADAYNDYYESCKDEVTGRDIFCQMSVQWFVVTDIGLSYYKGPEEFYVMARSLATGKPARDVKIQLLAANNRVLAESDTDSAGVASFKSRFTKGADGNRLVAIVAYQGADFSFINFSHDVFDLSDHGIAGRRPPRFFDSYVYPDRGVYRPDETIHTTVLVRDTDGNAAERIPPVTVKLRASNGKIIEEKRIDSNVWQLGGAAIDLLIPASAPLGQADILVYIGEEKEPIGTATVQLDHFRPDRARISLGRETDWHLTTKEDQTVTIKGLADAQYLYGIREEGSGKSDAPAANLAGEVSMLIQAAPTPFDGCYADFTFGRMENDVTPLLHRQALANRTDATGGLALETTAKLPHGDSPLQARFTLTLFDEGGKVGQQSRLIHIPVQRQWLGVRHETRLLPTKDGLFDLKLSMVALDARNELRTTRLSYRIWRERNVFIWHQDSHSWRYQPDVQRTLVKDGSVFASAGDNSNGTCKSANAAVELELPLGRYYVEVEDGSGSRVSFRQDAGWSGAGAHEPTPDRLSIYTDAHKEGGIASYRPGETATFFIEAPFDGEVLLAIANDKVQFWDSTTATVNRQATIKVRIDPRWAGDGFYALATAFRRNTDGTVTNGPSRAMGAVYFAVDREAERRLKLEIDTRDLHQISAERPFSFTLRSDGLRGRAWATAYAVDEGLLSLNNHPEPDPFAHFFGQRALGLEVFDNYGRILLADKSSRDRSGGDRSRRLFLTNYTSDRVVAKFSGPVEFVDGVAHIQFDKPFDFSGTVRIAAIAWTDRKVGAATGSVVPRQRIVADLRTPRFMTPGDRATVTLLVRPVDAMPSRYRVRLVPAAPLTLEGMTVADRGEGSVVAPGTIELDLGHGEARSIEVALSLPPDTKSATSQIDISIEGANDDVKNEPPITRSFDVAIRPAEAPTMDMAFVDLQPNETLKLDSKRVMELARGNFIEKGLGIRLYASTDPLGAARWIYPDARSPRVGMLERIVWRGMMFLHGNATDGSKALPSLVREIEALQSADGFYVGYRLVSETGLDESQDIIDRSDDPVGRFERYQIWRTALALDFLSQARNAGIQVNYQGLRLGVDALHDKLRSALQTESFGVTSDNGDQVGDSGAQPTEARSGFVEDRDDPQDAERRRGFNAQQITTARPERSPSLISKLLNDKGDEKKKSVDAEKQKERAADTDKQSDEVEDTSAPSTRDIDPCDEDMLYAAFILAQYDAIDRFDLAALVRQCGKSIHPLGAAMLAAALSKFGVVEEARGVLASIDTRGGATGDDAATEGTHFDAMMLAFLALADAKPPLRSELAVRLTRSHRPLSLAAKAWLARAYAESGPATDAGDQHLNLVVEGRLEINKPNEHELVSEAVPMSELSRRDVTLHNTGQGSLTVALLLRGIPLESSGTPKGELKIQRRVIDQRGEIVDLQKTKLKPNDLLYVVLTGEREQQGSKDDKARLQDPVVIVDRLPASFEIVDRDVFELARSEGATMRAVLPSDGKQGRLRVAEARDDEFLAVVKPTPAGNFQIGYSVRVVAAGRFVHPGTIIEDLYRSEIATQTGSSVVQVEGRGQP